MGAGELRIIATNNFSQDKETIFEKGQSYLVKLIDIVEGVVILLADNKEEYKFSLNPEKENFVGLWFSL